jgi:transposase
MPAERIAMHNIKELLRLKYDCALSHERIARALSISKGVVAKYVKAAEASGVGWAELAAADEARLRALLGGTPRPRGTAVGYRMPDLAAVHQGLKRKNVTLALLWEEYVQATAGPTYQYSRFCDLYRDFAKGLKRSMRQVHRAGEKLFIDYAGDTVPIVDAETGEISRAQIFVAVLGASNYTFVCATATQSQADWLGALGRALRFIGGVPELIVPDNTRSMVGEPDRYAPQLQRTTAEFAQHYGVAILPARPYKPQDKSKVEVGVQIVQRWILARLRQGRRDLLRHPFLNGRRWKRTVAAGPGAEAPVFDRRVVAVGLAPLDGVAGHQPLAIGREQQAAQQYRFPNPVRYPRKSARQSGSLRTAAAS